MSFINMIIGVPLGYVMWACYKVVNNYGFAIILFTFLTKVILFPLSLLVQKNSIKMVKLQPQLEEIKARYAGDKDRIAEEQIKIYDSEHYSPAMGCLPMFIQIPMILGLINVIYNPLRHLLHLNKEIIDKLIARYSEVLYTADLGRTPQLKLIEIIHIPEQAAKFMGSQGDLTEANIDSIISQIQAFNLDFFGLDLSLTPSIFNFNLLILIPIFSGMSALLMCLIQNKINVLQRGQNNLSKWGMTIFTVAFSSYFTFIIPAGVGLYWIFSNVFAILQMIVLNIIYDPRKHINYEEKSATIPVANKEEQKVKALKEKENRKREKEDYKRFFTAEDKKLVFYSEKSGFYKYFENVISEILENSDLVIHYVTSDAEDAIFKKNSDRIIPYYIGDVKLIPFMMKIDADMVVMTMPDLQQFHIKRSLVRKDIEYVYMFHGPFSTHSSLRKGALDFFDTIFCIGQYQIDEIRETEKIYKLKPKKLVECGYGLIENLTNGYSEMSKVKNDIKKILIAPSWQKDNILDSCIDEILSFLLNKGFNITVRPHPEYIKRFSEKMDNILTKYSPLFDDNFRIETDFSSNETIFLSDLLITDWSGIAYEFSCCTKKPSLFINTPMKVVNEEYEKLTITPLEIVIRNKIGTSLDLNRLDNLPQTIDLLFEKKDEYEKSITEIIQKNIFNFGESGKIGSDYILNKIRRRINEDN